MKKCSGCGQEDITVHRNTFDGLCASCTTKALYSDSFRARAQQRNKELKRQEGVWENG